MAKAKSSLPIRKHCPIEDIGRLEKLGFEQYGDGEQWSKEFPYDDQTFPQQVLCLSELLKLSGKSYSRLRGELNSFERKVRTIELREYGLSTDKNRVLRLAELQEEKNSGTLEAHSAYFDIETSQYFFPLVFTINEEVVGFVLLDKMSKQCVAYNALIYDTSIPNLSSAITFETAKIMTEKGFKYLNLQGSETESLDRWKRKFCPERVIRRTHLVYRGG